MSLVLKEREKEDRTVVAVLIERAPTRQVERGIRLRSTESFWGQGVHAATIMSSY